MQQFMQDYESFSQSWWLYSVTLVLSVIFAIRLYVGGTACPSAQRIDGKNVIITGSSSGIGLEVAKELARRGGNIIMAVRNAEKAKLALDDIKLCSPGAKVVVKLVDLAESSSIRDFVKDISREFQNIDVLINNAAIAGHPFKKTMDGNELTLSTNFLGPFLLTHLLLKLLEKSPEARVINVSASTHFNGSLNLDDLNSQRNFVENNAFVNSKLALTVITKQLAEEFQGKTNITFNSVSPGLVRGTNHLKFSRMQSNFMVKLSVLPWIWLFLKSPKQASQSLIYLAVEPSLNSVSGCYFSDCEVQEAAKLVEDKVLGKKLYEKSLKIVGYTPEEL